MLSTKLYFDVMVVRSSEQNRDGLTDEADGNTQVRVRLCYVCLSLFCPYIWWLDYIYEWNSLTHQADHHTQGKNGSESMRSAGMVKYFSLACTLRFCSVRVFFNQDFQVPFFCVVPCFCCSSFCWFFRERNGLIMLVDWLEQRTRNCVMVLNSLYMQALPITPCWLICFLIWVTDNDVKVHTQVRPNTEGEMNGNYTTPTHLVPVSLGSPYEKIGISTTFSAGERLPFDAMVLVCWYLCFVVSLTLFSSKLLKELQPWYFSICFFFFFLNNLQLLVWIETTGLMKDYGFGISSIFVGLN